MQTGSLLFLGLLLSAPDCLSLHRTVCLTLPSLTIAPPLRLPLMVCMICIPCWHSSSLASRLFLVSCSSFKSVMLATR